MKYGANHRNDRHSNYPQTNEPLSETYGSTTKDHRTSKDQNNSGVYSHNYTNRSSHNMHNSKGVPTSSHKSNVNGFDSYARISGNFSEPSSKEINAHNKEASKYSNSNMREQKPSSSFKPQIPETQKSTYSEIDRKRSN